MSARSKCLQKRQHILWRLESTAETHRVRLQTQRHIVTDIPIDSRRIILWQEIPPNILPVLR